MTHPFHPLSGQELEFVKRRRNWRADRVYFHDKAGELASLPAEWTDLVPDDPFVVVAGGRSPFHVDALLELSELVVSLAAHAGTAGRRARRRQGPRHGGRQANYAEYVRRIMPGSRAELAPEWR